MLAIEVSAYGGQPLPSASPSQPPFYDYLALLGEGQTPCDPLHSDRIAAGENRVSDSYGGNKVCPEIKVYKATISGCLFPSWDPRSDFRYRGSDLDSDMGVELSVLARPQP